jgi:class 3 adenylate cyclase/predicted ATPase
VRLVTNELLDIGTWLKGLGLSQYHSLFVEQQIDLESLADLTEDDLKRFGIPTGARKQLKKAIATLILPRSKTHQRTTKLSSTVSGLAQRRQLTVLFCDLVGSTALAVRLDPEDFREIINAYIDTCANVVAKFGGHVAGILGDGVVVYFGYPQAQEDAVERSALAGLSLIQAIRNFRAPSDVILSVRIGIATGTVIIDEDDRGVARIDERVTGPTPNLAARLQEVAKPNTVIISDTTKYLLGDLFDYRDLGAHHLKGIDAPVQVWQILCERRVESRFEATRVGNRGVIIGRDAEVALLLSRWKLVQEAEEQVVLLSGQAGIGKSRVASAFVDCINTKGEPHLLLRFQCSPTHTNTALYPVIAYLERAAGIAANDAPELKLDRFAHLMTRTGGDPASLVPTFASLLGISTIQADPRVDLSPYELKQRIFEAMVGWLIAAARNQPLLIVIEDAQWIDPTSREFVTLCIDRLETAAALILITHRPEFQHRWADLANVTSLSLNRLSRQQATNLVKQIAGGKTLPPEVLDQIIVKADGVPLFIEELTKTVLQSGLLREEADRYVVSGKLSFTSIPATLKDALLARLDFAAAMKEIAQIAATIGREFSYALLAAVAPVQGSALEAGLAQLARGEIIRQRHNPVQRAFSFRHALLRDAAYNTLLHSRRRELHSAVARALVDQFPDSAESQPEMVAHHFTEAGLFGPAVDWWEKAGRHALMRSANVEAATHFARAIEILRSQPESRERDLREFDLLLQLRPPLHATMGFASVEMQKALTRALLLGERLGESGKTLRLLSWQCAFNLARTTTAATLNDARRIIRIAVQAGDTGAMVLGYRNCGYAHLVRGELRTAHHYLKQAEKLHDPNYEQAHLSEYVFLAGPMTESIRCLAVQQLGELDQALTICKTALAEARRASHNSTIAYVGFHLALLHLVAGNVSEVEERVKELLEFMNQKNISTWRWHCEKLLGWVQARAGLLDEGLLRMREAADERQRLQTTLWAPFYRTREVEVLLIYGRYEEALSRLDDAVGLMRELEQHYAEAEAHRLRAVALSAVGAIFWEVETLFIKALDVARRRHTKLWELRAATSYAQFLRDSGSGRDPRKVLEPVYVSFTEGFDAPDLAQARIVLDSLG